ncbi:hypothetical protein D3C87_1885820 [compost metagenome]
MFLSIFLSSNNPQNLTHSRDHIPANRQISLLQFEDRIIYFSRKSTRAGHCLQKLDGFMVFGVQLFPESLPGGIAFV